MRSVEENVVAPPAKTAEPHRYTRTYDRWRHRVGHTADAVVDRFEDGVWTTRRAMRRNARKAQDAVYGAAGEIRRRPFSSVGAAFLAGATVAATITWIALRPGRRAH